MTIHQRTAFPAELSAEQAKANGKSLAELAEMALEALAQQTANGAARCGMISGPISTGGLEATATHGRLHRNLRALDAAIEEMRKLGYVIFSQMPYESRIFELARVWHEIHGADEYFQPILDEFYKPIFDSGYVSHLWLLPGWRSSKGAAWEQAYCVRKGIKTTQIEPEIFFRWIRERGI